MITVAYFSPIFLSVKKRLTAVTISVKRHAGGELRINHPLQGGRKQRGRDSLAAHVGQHDGQTLRQY